MLFLKHILLFVNQYRQELQRKWKTLPLLLLYPIAFLSLAAIIIITLFTPSTDEPIQVGLIDLDQTEETQLVVNILDQSSQLGSYINLHKMTEQEAIEQIKANNISSYITFPKDFTNHLYTGKQVTLELVGNPNDQIDSLLIKEFIDSVVRHIRASQANILTIDHFAQELGIDSELRNDLLFEQFTNFFFYTLDKDRSLNEQKITNYATDTPTYYFAFGSWFTIVTIWLISFYTLLYREEETLMSQRLSLYGVLHIQKIIARIIVTLIMSFFFAILLFYCLQLILPFNLFTEDYLKIFGIMLLYCLLVLISLAFIELLFKSQRIRLFAQVMFILIVISLSGAIIPSMYFPLAIQSALPYVFSNEAFYRLQEIVLEGRIYVNYLPLILMNCIASFSLVGFSLWKERLTL